MEICWDDEINYIKLHWSIPRLLKEFEKEQPKIDDAYFYSLSASWNESEDRLLYIGMTYDQDVLERMQQYGIKKCKKAHPRQSTNLIVSVATVEDWDGNITEKLIKDVEALLIYGSWCKSMLNDRSINAYTGRLFRQLVIENTGFTLLPKKIFWGASSSK